MIRSIILFATAAAVAAPAFAQTADAVPAEASGEAAAGTDAPPAAANKSDTNDVIVVTGSRRRTDDVLGEVSVLGGEDLANAIRPTLGATLASQPGVSASGSGPNVARPVLRGLAGDRIRILTDGIGSLDVSASSSDHAVAINPLNAESIEVLHGPAALIFGSSAVGGVVNVIDSRIPRHMPDAPLHAAGIAAYASAAKEKLLSGKVDVPIAGHIVAHGDVSWTKNGDLETGGFILARPLRRQAAASPAADVRALADLRGKLPNSDGRTFEAAGALAYVDGGLNIGASVTRHTAFYGVPIRYSLDPDIESEATHIDVHQTRYDARAEIPLEGFLKKVRLRGGYSNYNHAEIAADGEIGSRIFSKGGEVRLDLDQRDTVGGRGGASGVQYLDLKQYIDGDEQFLPPVHQRSFGLFTVQHLEQGPFRVEAGARYERNDLKADASDVVGNPNLKRNFSTLSLSTGGRYALSKAWTIGLNIARSQRAPSAEELFANGPHGGNASFQVGDPDLNIEKSVGFEASVKHASDAFTLTATVYGSRFGNFLYEAPTGEIEDDLPVYQARQGRATYTGFETEAEVRLGKIGGVEWGVEGVADATRAQIKGVGPAPLIPPLRVQGALTGKAGRVNGRLEVEHDWAQRRNARLELETAGFTLVNANIDWKPLVERPDLTLSLAANNIFDVEARRSTSLLKDFAPIAGRDIRATASFSF
ncbi:MAG: TonB-dependent receptor [Sphingomonas sp.]|uniref:TonB-dependent receptor n=1 Tax=Sphingomonas sp. TaxID=28214 RepID=UPI0017EBFD4E|nr:TonB-dependent receptor [Sphingomonas sp.]MBA3667998.1 TonB-dependent receptor [Sphingomonas sp.]